MNGFMGISWNAVAIVLCQVSEVDGIEVLHHRPHPQDHKQNRNEEKDSTNFRHLVHGPRLLSHK